MIRLAAPEDAEGCLAIYRPVVRHTAISFETEVPTPDQFRARIGDVLTRAPWLVADSGDAIEGYAYATPYRNRAAYRWSMETTVYVAESAQRHGLGRRLYAALLECLREQGYVNALAAITLPNPASVALHERLGFRPAGVLAGVGYKLGRWHDVGWWQLRLRPNEDPPRDPLTVTDSLARLGRKQR